MKRPIRRVGKREAPTRGEDWFGFAVSHGRDSGVPYCWGETERGATWGESGFCFEHYF